MKKSWSAARGLKLVVVAVLMSSAAPAAAEAKRYSLADLQALLESQSWSELVGHLEDVAPAKRNAAWKTVVEAAAKGYVTHQKLDKNPLGALVAADLFTKRYTWIKKRKAFMEVRASAGIKGFKACLRLRYSGCMDRLLPFVKADKGNVKLALDAAGLLAGSSPHYHAIPFFALAVRWSKKRAKICLTDKLDISMFAALNAPKSWKKLIKPALAVAELCWKTVKPDLLNHLDVDGAGYKANVCPLLRKRKALSRAQAAKCSP